MRPSQTPDTNLPLTLAREATDSDIEKMMVRARTGQVVLVATFKLLDDNTFTVLDVIPTYAVKMFVAKVQTTLDLLTPGSRARVEVFEPFEEALHRLIEDAFHGDDASDRTPDRSKN